MNIKEAYTKATPGPLETSSNAKREWDICMAGGGDMIADLSGCPNAKNNAPLLAHAYNVLPEVLEALEAVTDAYGCECTEQHKTESVKCPMCAARAIIAKASEVMDRQQRRGNHR